MFALASLEKADSLFLLRQPPRERPSLHDTSRAPLHKPETAKEEEASKERLYGEGMTTRSRALTPELLNQQPNNDFILHLKHKP